MTASPEFSALLATTQLEREKADGIRSLIAASKLAAGYQARAEKAEAALALTWLEIGAMTREGIAKQIESEMKYEGVRAQRVMKMCAGIARTWKP
jgi:hypothetical protein